MASLIGVQGLKNTSAGFRKALYEGAVARGLNPDHLATVISFESGFDPAARNRYSGAVGLIQWVSDSSFAATARKAGRPDVERSDLSGLSATEQLPFVFAWYDGKGVRSTSSLLDHYLAVFMPAHVGKARDTVVAREGSAAYTQNPAFDREKKGYYTLADIGRTIEARGAAGAAAPRIPVDFSAIEFEAPRWSPGMLALGAVALSVWLLPKLGLGRRLLRA